MHREDLPDLDASHLKMLAGLIAEFTQQDLSPEKPLLSATLPQGPSGADRLAARRPGSVPFD